MEYYESRLDEEQRVYYHTLIAGYKARESRIKSVGLTEKRFWDVVNAVEYDCPDIFYTNLMNRTAWMTASGWELEVKYLYDAQQIRQVEDKIEEIVRCIQKRISELKVQSIYNKCMVIHDYLVQNCVYDYEAYAYFKSHESNRENPRPQAYSIVGLVNEKKAVCAGIASAFRLFCQRFGIEAIYVSGHSWHPKDKDWNNGGHAWNIVRVGEHCAQIDVTWDICWSGEDAAIPIRYDYFFLTDLEMLRNHQFMGYPHCGVRNQSYLARTNRVFHNCDQLKEYVDKVLKERTPGQSVFHFYFKMNNRSMTKKQVESTVADMVCNTLNKGIHWWTSTNDAFSIYGIKVVLKDS